MKNKLFFKLPGTVIIFVILSSCVSVKVTTNYDKSIDFTKYKTAEYHGWHEGSDKLLSPFDKKDIEEAFRAEFKKRGITFVESGGDMVVALYIHLQKKTQTTATTNHYPGYGGYYGGHYGYGPGWGWGPTYSTTTVNTYDYLVGTLICDIYDQKNKQLIWEGTAVKTVDEDPNTREKNIPIAVERLMRYYPVPPLKKK